MILPFSTQLNGKPTHFVSKIWVGIESKFSEFNYKGNRLFNFPKEYIKCGEKGLLTFQKPKPKLHTIREDKNDRWKRGTKIDFFINCRQKNMFRFAPVLTVTSTQRIFMTYMPHVGNGFQVSIAGNEISKEEIEKLAINDGFENVEDFENYFISVMKEDEFSGKIIHWTDFKY